MRYQIRHARVQFGGDVILRDINFEVHDREKIAIVGRNGCGKTTLLKLIAGDIEMSNPDSDEECGITMAGGQEIGFLRQVNFVDAEVTVEDELKKVFVPVFACEERMKELEEQMKTAAETKETAPDGALLREYDRLQKQMEAMRGYSWRRDMETMFQRFGFALEDLRRPIGSFSGGQQTKVAFIKLLLTRPDIMLLDEPTNHMDMRSKDILKSAVMKYDGTVIVVSHDREFLDGMVQKVYEFRDGGVQEYLGGIYYFLEKRKLESLKEVERKAAPSAAAPQQREVSSGKLSYEQKKEQEKLIRKLKKNVEQIETELAGVEREIAAWDEKFAAATAYDEADYKAYNDLKARYDHLMHEWEKASYELEIVEEN